MYTITQRKHEKNGIEFFFRSGLLVTFLRLLYYFFVHKTLIFCVSLCLPVCLPVCQSILLSMFLLVCQCKCWCGFFFLAVTQFVCFLFFSFIPTHVLRVMLTFECINFILCIGLTFGNNQGHNPVEVKKRK